MSRETLQFNSHLWSVTYTPKRGFQETEYRNTEVGLEALLADLATQECTHIQIAKLR